MKENKEDAIKYFNAAKERHLAILDNVDSKMARAICASCVVKDECLAWALTTKLDGILAGTTSREREQLKARRLRRAS